jgi:hypothetical protein
VSRWSSSRCNLAHWRSQCIPLNRTCKKDFGLHLSKTTLFLVSQIAHQRAAAAVRSNKLCLDPPNFDQWLNISSILVGFVMPNTICTVRHRNFAYEQLKNRCRIVSGKWQKQQFLSPFQLGLARLSLVKITPFFIYHKNPLKFLGTLLHHC